MTILLEIDPNIVKPGWTPLLILLALGGVMVLLYRSMRRQFRRVDSHFPEEPAPGEAADVVPEDRDEAPAQPAPADGRPQPPR